MKVLLLDGGPAEGALDLRVFPPPVPQVVERLEVTHVHCGCGWCEQVEGDRVVHIYETQAAGVLKYVRSEPK